jgi:hypothetical protein
MNRVFYKTLTATLSAAAVFALSGCLGTEGSPSESGGGDLVNTVTSSYRPVFPTAPDSFEGDSGDNNMSNASNMEVGEPLQSRSIFPTGDYDWVKVELEEGVVYDIFAFNLNETGDTYLYLYDENGAEITHNDDYIDYDSYIEYNATYTGTHYLKVRSYDVLEPTSYQLGIRVHVDNDDDGYSAVYDCNDNNATIFPYAREIPGDGIDQDCSGVDAIGTGIADPFENDNDMEHAKPFPETTGSISEIEFRRDIYSKMRTLHDIDDKDFYVYTIPPHTMLIPRLVNLDINGSTRSKKYDENGTEISGLPRSNPTDTPKTYYVEIYSEGGVGWYVVALMDYGVDMDGDGFYTKQWGADCDDTNASIYPGADDSNDTDGIDMNCDGIDGENSNYES